jgi:competence protein ComEC
VLLVLISLFVFVVITGAEASVLRAGIMGAIVLLSKTAGRLSNVTSILILTAVIMSLSNPFVIVHDIGFQLSYLSTLGLLYFADPLTRKISFVPKKFEMRDSLALTLASQVTTFPITVYHFGRLSIIAPLVNVLVLPLIPFSMFEGFFATLIAYFSKGIGQIIAWPAYLCLKLKILIISFFSSLPFVSIEITKNIKMEVLLLYGIIFFFYFVYKKMKCTKNT